MAVASNLIENELKLSLLSRPTIKARYEKLLAGHCDSGKQIRDRDHLLVLACVCHHKWSRQKIVKSYHQGKRPMQEDCDALYCAARLAFHVRLDTDGVAILLREMYICESSFRELVFPLHFTIYGLEKDFPVAGSWYDMKKLEKGHIAMLDYFMAQATKRRLVLDVRGTKMRFRVQDGPLDRLYMEFTPLEEAIENESTEVVELLLRYGAKTELKNMWLRERLAVDVVLTFLYSNHTKREAFVSGPMVMKYKRCLRLLLRAVLQVRFPLPSLSQSTPFPWEEIPAKEAFFAHAVASGLVPASRAGRTPPELKHQCRVKIRRILYENWQLPRGIAQLNLPRCLEQYLDLKQD